MGLLAQLDALLLQNCTERGSVNGALIEQRILNPVPEIPVKVGDLSPVPAHLPDLALVFRQSRVLDYPTALLTHQLVVYLRDLPVQFVLRQCPPSHVVVIDHGDVVVGMAAEPVGMSDDEAVAVGMQLLSEHVPEIVDFLDVVRIVRIELRVFKALDHRLCFDLATVFLGEQLSPADELFRARRVARNSSSTVRARLHVRRVLRRTPRPIELIPD